MEFAGLLQRHLPVLRYDSQEAYFADSAAEWTDNPGNELLRADGTVLASAAATVPAQQLALGFLGHEAYADGTAVARGDRIKDRSHDYLEQARSLHAQARYANRVYGHWASGSDGRVWLSYWFFYFYNDYNLLGELLAAGLHEGGWEMIQLRLNDAAETPDLAVYAQHAAAAAREWSDVERIGERPVVYPARGSHASYFEPGIHWTGYWFDHANGQRSAHESALEVIRDDDASYRWATWPGIWGGTEPQAGLDRLLGDSSPRGPGGHRQWHDPHALLLKSKDRDSLRRPAPELAVLPMAPIITLRREGEGLHIDYSTSDSDLALLVVSVNSPQEPMPPAIYRTPIASARGEVLVAAGLHDDWGYDVHVSTATRDGRASASTAGLLAPM